MFWMWQLASSSCLSFNINIVTSSIRDKILTWVKYGLATNIPGKKHHPELSKHAYTTNFRIVFYSGGISEDASSWDRNELVIHHIAQLSWTPRKIPLPNNFYYECFILPEHLDRISYFISLWDVAKVVDFYTRQSLLGY